MTPTVCGEAFIEHAQPAWRTSARRANMGRNWAGHPAQALGSPRLADLLDHPWSLPGSWV
ncbi:hypothetical protein ACFUJY_29885 [Streptomyces sp. NPDC057249]|uniref:hypothetical protein n=1 Tax=Streptomyces sp. NPDC057249 TaxID=3346067 RepID=UPI0036459D9D